MLNTKKHNNTNLNFLGRKRLNSISQPLQSNKVELFLILKDVKPLNLNCNFKLKDSRQTKNKMKFSAIKNLQENSTSCPKAPHNTTQYIVRIRRSLKLKQIKRETALDEIKTYESMSSSINTEDEFGISDEFKLTGGTMKGNFTNSILTLDDFSEETNETAVSYLEKEHFFCLRDTSNLEIGQLDLVKYGLRELPYLERDAS